MGEVRGQVESPVANTPPKGEREEGKGGGATLAEERLKWQMEMENLRRECEARETGERVRCEEEVGRWREKVGELEERWREVRVERVRETSKELEQTKERSALLSKCSYTYYIIEMGEGHGKLGCKLKRLLRSIAVENNSCKQKKMLCIQNVGVCVCVSYIDW